MEKMKSTFTEVSESSKTSAAIKVALRVSLKTLDKYYNLTDAADVYRMAMGMFYYYF